MRHTNKLTPMLAALLIGALTTPLMADERDDRDCRMRGGMMGGMMGRMMGGDMDAMLERVDGRLAFIKAELKITDAQTAAWDEFAKSVKSSAENRNEMMSERRKQMMSGDFAKMPLPERLELQENHMTARLEQIKATRQALTKLYAVLDDKQKEAANEVVLPMIGMGRMMGQGMGRGMGRGMGQGMGRGMMDGDRDAK